ncbi:MAG: hypothetical protein NVS9B12_03210 [Vulcanimicrobiaceae bacterium]
MTISTRAAGALLVVILLGLAASASERAGHPHRRSAAPVAPSLDMYSLRARRRAATLLRLELLELRKAHLERVRAVIEKRLPIDALLNSGPLH